MLEPLGVAIHTVDLSHIRVGETVVVLGAGPIGLLIAAVAKAAGAGQILMTEPVADRRAFALNYIAEEVFDPNEQDVVEEVMRATGGRGVDIVFEAAGADEAPQQGADMLRPGGTLVLCGIPDHRDRLVLKASVIRRKGLNDQNGAANEVCLSPRHPHGAAGHGRSQINCHTLPAPDGHPGGFRDGGKLSRRRDSGGGADG